jgi:hypothetical protein
MVKAVSNMKNYLEEVGHLTKFNPQDAWLPITESRTGNAYYAAFHNLNAGIGFQGLILPFAMFYLGWYVSPLPSSLPFSRMPVLCLDLIYVLALCWMWCFEKRTFPSGAYVSTHTNKKKKKKKKMMMMMMMMMMMKKKTLLVCSLFV